MKAAFIPLCLFSVVAWSGTEALGPKAALEDFLAYAEAHNPGLQAAKHRWQAEAQAVEQSDTLPNPTLSYTYFVDEVETRVGPQKQKFGVKQQVPWFGTLGTRGRIAEASAQAAHGAYQAERLRLIYEVKKAFYEYGYLHQAIAVMENNVALLEHLDGLAQARVRSGGTQTAAIKAQVEWGKLKNQLQSLRDLRVPMAAQLNAILNRSAEAALPWPVQLKYSEDTLPESTLLAARSTQNPELQRMDHLVEKKARAVALAKKGGYPGFSFGIETIDTGRALNPDAVDSGKDPLMAMVAVNIPLWRGKVKADVDEARHLHEGAVRQRDQQFNTLEASLHMALYRFRDAHRKIALYRDTLVPQARQALGIQEEAYRSGIADFLNLIDAERLLLEFELAHRRALTDREIARARIEQLVGGSLNEIPNPPGEQ